MTLGAGGSAGDVNMIKGPLLVTAAVIENSDGEVLMAQRPRHHKIAGGQWEFPGGKVEAGETLEACLKREIFEELGVEIEVKQLIGNFSHVYQTASDGSSLQPSIHIVLATYRACLVGASTLAGRDVSKFRLQDVASVRWCSLSKRPEFEIAAADVKIVDTVWGSVKFAPDLA